MKAYEIMEKLFAYGAEQDYSNSCDTLKAGSPDAEVTKVAVSMFATIEVVRQARDWGAQLLIVHEPTYYNHMDDHSNEQIECEKRAFLEQSGLTVYRFHDHPHAAAPDLIAAGMIRDMDLDCEIEYTDVFDLVRLHLNTPMTSVQLAKRIEEKLGIRHVRICGERNKPCTKVSGMFGTPGGVFEELQGEQCEIMLTGEICEWALGEYVRDAAMLGHNKALLVLGHIGSERNGMIYTADLLKEKCPELEVQYFECGEVYTYTDSESCDLPEKAL